MENIPKALLAAATVAISMTAHAGVTLVGKVPLNGGSSVFKLFNEPAVLPECRGPGMLGMTAALESPRGTIPYGTGCWRVGADGFIHMAVKSFDDGVVRETAVHNSQFTELNDRRAPVRPTPLVPPIAPEKKSTYHVDMADADVTLEDEPCKGGGKKASFKHKLYDIGGYGCWIDGGQQILVHWTRKKTLSGTIEPFDLHSKIQRPADMPAAATANHAPEQPSRKVKELISRVDTTAMSCRDLQTQAACDRMAEAVSAVMKAGWCWGPEDVASSEKHWSRCK